ncbi:MAG: alpha-glucosidase [Fibromonadaceae bacterium]|jgi:alpha-glucosidase|nr:alpha-glucosidase [Fibromonadaceae bacterium]
MNKDFCWWKHGVIYHVYPQSFYDTNDDGIGDLQGIIQKLDYLANLGVDALWLSPIYPSPLVDAGYDITDYKNINSIYGDMNDFMQLLKAAHKKGIRIIMDLVLNHTSDQHPWFKESRSSIDNPKRDWYIWQAPKNKKAPNNWRTNFGKKAWQYDAATGEYYYHSFFYEQPDLNWRNPEVKEAMFEIAEFWLKLGIDGFRLDVINLLYKDKKLRDNSISNLFSNKKKVFNRNRGSVYKVLREFRVLLDKYADKVSVGEIYAVPPGDTKLASSFLGSGNDMLHLAFDFSLIFTRWKATFYYKTIRRIYSKMPKEGWPCFFLSNHDVGRSTKRFGLTFFKYQKAKLHALLLLTLKGTPFIYYGDEIGMENASITKDQIRDLYGKLFYPLFKGRDGFRTPMQWNSNTNAGFSNAKLWLPVHPNYYSINVEAATNNENSVYSVYKQLLQLRKTHKALQSGNIKFLHEGKNNVLAYQRFLPSEKLLIFLNFSFLQKQLSINTEGLEQIFSTHPQFNSIAGGKIVLKPYQGVVFAESLIVRPHT